MTDCRCHSHNGFVVGKSPKGLAQRSLEGFDVLEVAERGVDRPVILDRSGSVSGSRRDEIKMIFDEGVIDEQHRRFLDAGCSKGEEVR